MLKPNMRIIGFFGESGAGKTTIIRNIPSAAPGKNIVTNTGIIRYLFQKNGEYGSPRKLLNDSAAQLDTLKPNDRNAKIDEIFEKYVRGQFQLLNDYSTEVYLATTEISVDTPIYLLLDRSPLDFYVLTICGLEVLEKALGRKPQKTALHFLDLMRKTAEKNTKNFFTHIVVTKPWKDAPNKDDRDGVRDEYLANDYRGDNWYGRLSLCDIGNVKTFEIPQNIEDLNARVERVCKYLEVE